MYSRPAVESDLFSLEMFAPKEKIDLLKSRLSEVIITQSDFKDKKDFVAFSIGKEPIVYINGY